jgi:hypothetical protein|tara:strand:- start:800 stop:1036 length:237 start_codon:yes stop_codon:yes gene_type:complete
MSDRYADRFETDGELLDHIIDFYEGQIDKFLRRMGGTTEHGVEITPSMLGVTVKRYTYLLEKRDEEARALLEAEGFLV